MSAIRALRPALRAALRAPRVAAPRVVVPAFASRSFHATLRARGSGESELLPLAWACHRVTPLTPPADGELAAALAAEHAYETESATDEKPEFFKNLEQDGVWAVKDVAGSDDVILSRKFGDEQ